MATATEKKVNFTAEQFAILRDAYFAAIGYDDKMEAIKRVAPTIGHSTRSCIAKLSREKVYIKKEYTTKNGEKPVEKNELVTAIAKFLDVSVEFAGSLEKANKGILQELVKAFDEFSAKETD